uniref:uncharacterized protein LOC120347326 isoform X2 n=1 Tax=Styela clava TaxID=7725 RepID=UPI00193A1107|nr:uncharacterized protein LOC120347326 isoform X2 [Styela clava]
MHSCRFGPAASANAGMALNIRYVSNLETADDIVRQYEEHTTSKFVISKQNKNFGKEVGPIHLNSRILWEDIANAKAAGYRLQFDGIPFMVVGHKILDCHHGSDRHVAAKAKYKAQREADEIQCKKRKMVARDSKKVGCTARIRMREILKFPDHKIAEDSRTNRLQSSKQLKKDIAEKEKIVEYERRIYIELPDETDHCNHSIGEDNGQLQRIDKVIVKFIHCQVYAGIDSSEEIKSKIYSFVRDHMFKDRCIPPPSNRRYHPRSQDVKNHIYAAKARLKSLTKSEVKEFNQLSDLIHKTTSSDLQFTNDLINPSQSSPHTMDLTMLENSVNALSCMNDIIKLMDNDHHRFDSGYIDAEDCDDIEIVSPVTVQLQVEPETTNQMTVKCQTLLDKISEQTKVLRDPDTLHKLQTRLQDTLEFLLNEETASDKDIVAEDFVEHRKHPSLLETKLRGSNFLERKRPLICENDFSDSDYEIQCEAHS